MNCHNCGVEVTSGAVSCQQCGMRLQLQCPVCQFPSVAGNRFCGNCGHNLAESVATPVEPAPAPPPEEPAPAEPFPEEPEPVAAPFTGPVTCTRCFQANEADSVFCFSCGAALRETAYRRDAGPRLPAFELGNPGGFGFRAVAYIIDTLVVVMPLVFFWIVLGQPVPENFDQIWDPPEGYDRLQIGVLFLTMAYDTALITYFATTIGKRAFGLYVVRSDGSRVGFIRALARHVLTALSANLTLGFIFLVVMFREDRRGLHDIICDTVVIRRHRQRQPEHPYPDNR